MSIQRTHWYGCWKSGPEHYECAVGEIKRLRERKLNAAEAEVERLHGHLARVMSWIDNWSPEFVYDPEWRDEVGAVRAALDAARGES